MVSYQEGLTTEDFYVANFLKKLRPKKVLLLVNKAENYQPDDPELSQY